MPIVNRSSNTEMVSVPEGFMLVERSIWTDQQVDSAAACITLLKDVPGMTDRDLAMAAIDAAQCKAPDITLADILPADQHPAAPKLTEDLREILGRPNFTCHFIAKALRVMGHSIAHKSEDEQAVVIHWLLGIYLKHGPDWRQRAAAELEEASQSLNT